MRETVDSKTVQAIKELVPKLTTQQLMDVARELGCHYATVQRYGWGQVKKVAFAKKLLAATKSILGAASVQSEAGEVVSNCEWTSKFL